MINRKEYQLLRKRDTYGTKKKLSKNIIAYCEGKLKETQALPWAYKNRLEIKQ